MPKPLVGDLIDRGRARRLLGDAAGAAALFAEACTLDPGSAPAGAELGRALIALGRADEADAAADRVLGIAAAHAGAQSVKAGACRLRGDLAGAAQLLERAAAAHPGNLGLKVDHAIVLREQGRHPESDRLLEAVLAANPRHAPALIQTAHGRRRDNDLAGAAQALRTALEAEPTDLGAHTQLAHTLFAQGLGDEAVAGLQEAIDRLPGGPAARLALGRMLMEIGRLDEAEDAFGAAAAAHPGSGAAQAALGGLARRLGDRRACRELLTRAAGREPENEGIRLELAGELREAGAIDEARSLIESKLAGGRDARWWMQLGLLERAQGRRSAALEAFRRADGLGAASAGALVESAREHWALGEPGEALAALAAAREREPGAASPYVVGAELALDGEDAEKALILAHGSLELEPRHLGAHVVAVRAASANCDFQGAEAALARARERLGARPELAVAGASLLMRKLDLEGARAVIEEARADFPEAFGPWLKDVEIAIVGGDLERAGRLLQRAPAQTQAERARAWAADAQLALARHDHRRAIASYERALELLPFDAGWRDRLALARMLAADLGEARRELVAKMQLTRSAVAARRGSANASQSFLGQILDEVALCEGGAPALRAILRAPSGRRLATLGRLVAREPDATLPAILFLDAVMRKRAALAGGGKTGRATEDGVPDRICQFWNEAQPPDDVCELMDSWRRLNPSHEYERFDDASAERFIAERHSGEVLRAFRRSTEAAQRSDLFRLAWLADRGGAYLDADDLALAPLAEIVGAGAGLVGFREDLGSLGNNFLAARPAHPVILRALALATGAVNRGDHDVVWLKTGPGLVTRAFAQIAVENPAILRPGAVTLLELWQARRVVGMHYPARYKLTRRHWARAAFKHRAPAPDAQGALLRAFHAEIG